MLHSSVAASADTQPAPRATTTRRPVEAKAAGNLLDLCAPDSPLNLLGGQSLEALRDDLAAKLARYNEVRVRRGFAPIANIRDVA
jgi:hypothetical protein